MAANDGTGDLEAAALHWRPDRRLYPVPRTPVVIVPSSEVARGAAWRPRRIMPKKVPACCWERRLSSVTERGSSWKRSGVVCGAADLAEPRAGAAAATARSLLLLLLLPNTRRPPPLTGSPQPQRC